MKASRLAAEVSTLLLAYLGQKSSDKQPLDIAQTCSEALLTLKMSIPSNVVLQTSFMDPRPIVQADGAQIRQILINLVTNAWEAVGDGCGEVRVSTGVISAKDIGDAPVFPVNWMPTTEDYAYLDVSDTGSGMDGEARERIFDPFFSTKFAGRGLGLAVVEGIIRSHEGAVTVQSTPGLGSTFRVLLPLLRCEAQPRRSDQMVAANLPEGAGKVLVVEDEPMVREVSVAMLERIGLKVLTAADGIEAVEVFRKHQNEIACVLLDLTMPRMNGWETLMALRELQPGIPVILASGYDQSEAMAGKHAEKPDAFLHKPYQMAELKTAVFSVAGLIGR